MKSQENLKSMEKLMEDMDLKTLAQIGKLLTEITSLTMLYQVKEILVKAIAKELNNMEKDLC